MYLYTLCLKNKLHFVELHWYRFLPVSLSSTFVNWMNWFIKKVWLNRIHSWIKHLFFSHEHTTEKQRRMSRFSVSKYLHFILFLVQISMWIIERLSYTSAMVWRWVNNDLLDFIKGWDPLIFKYRNHICVLRGGKSIFLSTKSFFIIVLCLEFSDWFSIPISKLMSQLHIFLFILYFMFDHNTNTNQRGSCIFWSSYLLSVLKVQGVQSSFFIIICSPRLHLKKQIQEKL